MKQEIFRTIKSFPDYAVSNTGRIKRITPRKSNKFKNASPLLKTHIQRGYVSVTLTRTDGSWTPVRVNRLVCEAFNGAPFKDAEAAHLDGDKLNNNAENLKWKTAKNNTKDKYKHGTMIRGSKNYNAKLTEKDVIEIREERKNLNTTWKRLSEKYNVSVGCIRGCCEYRTWKHIN